jgi:D-serine dehydratase
MTSAPLLDPSIESSIKRRQPVLWVNDRWSPVDLVGAQCSLQLHSIREAQARLERFAGLLATLFRELTASRGIIESPLQRVDELQRAMLGERHDLGRWYLKCDHALPIAGSIKARGGVYEVLLHAERLAVHAGLMRADDDAAVLATAAARELFGRHHVSVGSTGNLGLSIGIMAAALGFRVCVHMSSDAKEWKKARLRARGVAIVQHPGDFGAAVSAGRAQAQEMANAYFVDDENSPLLFLGYSVAALRLQQQLRNEGVAVDAQHPLFVYLPCGVGGAPGGITFGLRQVFGDHVHCFLAEPVDAPCMLLRLACDRQLSVRDVGLDGRTEADGLAVARASEFAASMLRRLVAGAFTVPDRHLFEDLYRLERCEGLRVEPSAVAGFRGPQWILRTEAGQEYLAARGIERRSSQATHILWSTGGAFVPEDEYRGFHERGGRLMAARAGASQSMLDAN